MTPHARAQYLRIARLFVTGLITQPAIASFIASTAVRYPLVMAVIVAVEVTYHELTKPAAPVMPGSRVAPPGPPQA